MGQEKEKEKEKQKNAIDELRERFIYEGRKKKGKKKVSAETPRGKAVFIIIVVVVDFCFGRNIGKNVCCFIWKSFPMFMDDFRHCNPLLEYPSHPHLTNNFDKAIVPNDFHLSPIPKKQNLFLREGVVCSFTLEDFGCALD